MCRYAMYGPYKEHFACFSCRKAFKQTSRFELPGEPRMGVRDPRIVLCPQCREPMRDMGLDFAAPARDDARQWKKVEILFDHGFTYHTCGCGAGARPARLRDVAEFLKKNEHRTEGRELLDRFEQRRANVRSRS